MKRHCLRSLIITLITCLLGGYCYYQTDIESLVGLDSLFQLRGKRTPPPAIVVVAMDEQSKSDLGLWTNYTEWRKYHTKVVEELNRQGSALIVFDLNFIQPHPEEDAEFANAIRKAGNVLMTECIQRYDILKDKFDAQEQCSKQYSGKPVINGNDSKQSGSIRLRKIPYVPILGESALDHTPFYLADNAESSNAAIREAWTFISKLDEVPTLPVIAWFYYLQQNGNLANFKQPLSESLAKYRLNCSTQPFDNAEVQSETTDIKERINKLLCSVDDSQYLDFYGPPRTIRMVSYSDVYNGKITDFKGKIVFIGAAYSKSQVGKMPDSFFTPFTNNESGQMFGVEIMATHFANLLEGRQLTSPLPPLVILLCYAVLISFLLCLMPNISGIAISLVSSSAYVILAWWLFSKNAWWLPIAVPVLIQLPITWLISMYWSKCDAETEKQEVEEFAARIFPKWHPLITTDHGKVRFKADKSFNNFARNINGLSLATDIAGYTEIGAHSSPDQMMVLLQEYYKILAPPVKDRNGYIADTAGDAMMAFWEFGKLTAVDQRRACVLAALEMQAAVSQLNKMQKYPPLPTRIGIYEGEMTLGSIDAAGYVQYRAFGNALSEASRIEGANKYLGTQILASAVISPDLGDIVYRSVGWFLLKGLDEPIELIEIFSKEKYLAMINTNLLELFAGGLAKFQQGLWQEAITQFQRLLRDLGFDGPTQFYLQRAFAYQKNPPEAWDGIIKFDSK